MTNQYTVEAAFRYAADGPSAPSMFDWLDTVVEHLEDLGVDDVMVVSDTEDSSFVISLLVTTQSGDMPENIVGMGMSSLRTAFHACQASTPGWPSVFDAIKWVNLTAARPMVVA